ncbi:hypothetical protein XA68_17179 [Ophiocordyceps unilateralis]|uniref:Uncharacterized protein n=1 Tax=Ophiocordyceps unilateralis TaxID=268505 RepID=A0A2A9P594_OPHUN|nr:hypothetical protein XA68_17179 [Ophiocordyceps unilateralis]
MAPIPVYSACPINAATGSSDGNQDTEKAATTSDGRQNAQPGAVPALPAATGMPQPAAAAAIPSRVQAASPPAPQPGAAPVPPGLPPPPKAGETAAAKQRATAQTSTPPRLPPQLSYQAPAVAQPIQGRSSTAPTALGPHMHMGPGPYQASVPSAGGYPSHQGAQQAHGGSGYQSQQPYGFSGPQNSSTTSPAEGDNQSPGVWDTARKWASAAGESLAAAESEVWKRINKN